VTNSHPFRFGIQAATASSAAAWRDLALGAEALGYDILTMPDHFGDQLAPVPALAAAAAVTSRLRIGALVWDNDYKHPVVLAKELATMDVLSGGRLEVGLGAGWMRTDYEQSGMPYDAPGVRITRMEEGLAVIKGAFAPGPFDFEGTHYRIQGYDGLPKPVQARPPILIGGGAKRMLSVAAREGDIVGINGSLHEGVVGMGAIETMTAASVDAKLGWVKEAAGDKFDSLEINVRAFMTTVTDDRAGVAKGVQEMLGVEPSFLYESPFALIGTPTQIIDDLLARRERWGFSYVIVGPAEMEAFAPIVAELTGK
jgi:probable F420-dependent oxidoreductase